MSFEYYYTELSYEKNPNFDGFGWLFIITCDGK